MARKMTTPTKKPPAKAKSIPSPPRRTNATPPERHAKNAARIIVYAPQPPFSFEIYMYEASDTKDGFMQPLKRYCSKEEDFPIFQEKGFVKMLSRRVPFSANVPMLAPDNRYHRNVILRYPKTGESTSHTRQEGLQILKTFFADATVFRYPAANLPTIDATNDENYEPLDRFLMDKDIQQCLVQDFDSEVLDSSFVAKYPEFATKCWHGTHVSEFAKALGFST